MNDLGLNPAAAAATINKTNSSQPNPSGQSPKQAMSAAKQGGYKGLEGNLAEAKRVIDNG